MHKWIIVKDSVLLWIRRLINRDLRVNSSRNRFTTTYLLTYLLSSLLERRLCKLVISWRTQRRAISLETDARCPPTRWVTGRVSGRHDQNSVRPPRRKARAGIPERAGPVSHARPRSRAVIFVQPYDGRTGRRREWGTERRSV